MWDKIFKFYFNGRQELQEKVEKQEKISTHRLPSSYLNLWRMPGFLEAATGSIRTLEKKTIMESRQEWENGFNSIVAVIGYLGEGVSFFLKGLQRDFPAGQVFYLKFSRTIIDNNSLLEQIKVEDFRRLGIKAIVADNCQYLFLRKAGGFRALKNFLALVASTSREFFWITGWGRQSWIYLEQIFEFSSLFSTIVPFHRLEAKELEQLFSGTGTRGGFAVSVGEQFYNRMAEVTAGLFTPAIYYWLMCSEAVSGEAGELQIKLKERDDLLRYPWVEELPEKEVYLLLALLQGEGLTLAELKETVNQDYLSCQSSIAKFTKEKMVIVDQDMLFVNPLALPAVNKALEKRRIVSFAR